MPLQVPDDLLFFGQNLAGALGTVVVVALGVRDAAGLIAVQVGCVARQERSGVDCGMGG